MIEKSKRIGYFKRSNGDVVRCYRRAGNKILIVSVEEEDSNDAPSGSVLCPMWVEEESFFERNEDLRPISEREFSERVFCEVQKYLRTLLTGYEGWR